MVPGNIPMKIAICDDHRIVIEGLERLLADAEGLAMAGSALNGEDMLELLERTIADVVLLDLNMPGMEGAEVMQHIKQRWPATKVIILTMEDGPAMMRHLMDHGADGYVLKTSGREELITALHAVHAGRPYFSPEITESLLKPGTGPKAGKLDILSKREIEVLAALAEGLSNKEIGQRLFISPRTVDTHRTNIMKKLAVHNVAALVRIAFAAGLVR